MKKQILALIAVSLFLLSCNQDKNEKQDIVGNWKVVKETLEIEGSPETFEYSENKTYCYNFPKGYVANSEFQRLEVGPVPMVCAYRLSEDLSSLELAEDSRHLEFLTTYRIDRMDEHQLEMSSNQHKISLVR